MGLGLSLVSSNKMCLYRNIRYHWKEDRIRNTLITKLSPLWKGKKSYRNYKEDKRFYVKKHRHSIDSTILVNIVILNCQGNLTGCDLHGYSSFQGLGNLYRITLSTKQLMFW